MTTKSPGSCSWYLTASLLLTLMGNSTHTSPHGVVLGRGPLLPLLFNMVVDALVAILDKAKLAGHIRGVVPHLVPGGGVSFLQYADDTIIMVEGPPMDITNLKFLLLCFQQMSGLTINFAKSEVMVLGYCEAGH
jgi:hypothetical protein